MKISDSQSVRRFLFGGKAEFILVGKQSRFTYRLGKSKDNENLFFLSFNKKCIALLRDGQLFPIRRMLDAKEQKALAAFRWTYVNLERPAFAQAEFWHAGKCSCCSRKLTDPASIARGIGPECFKSIRGI